MSKFIIEPWHCDQDKVHVYQELWKSEINSHWSAVIHDLTIDEVKEVMKLSKWEEGVAPSCSHLAEICRDIVHKLKDVPVTKTQIGSLGFPVVGLTRIQIAWLHRVADEYREHCASYADNPFIDPIKFDKDELYLQLAEWFEENTDYVRED